MTTQTGARMTTLFQMALRFSDVIASHYYDHENNPDGPCDCFQTAQWGFILRAAVFRADGEFDLVESNVDYLVFERNVSEAEALAALAAQAQRDPDDPPQAIIFVGPLDVHTVIPSGGSGKDTIVPLAGVQFVLHERGGYQGRRGVTGFYHHRIVGPGIAPMMRLPLTFHPLDPQDRIGMWIETVLNPRTSPSLLQ